MRYWRLELNPVNFREIQFSPRQRPKKEATTEAGRQGVRKGFLRGKEGLSDVSAMAR